MAVKGASNSGRTLAVMRTSRGNCSFMQEQERDGRSEVGLQVLFTLHFEEPCPNTTDQGHNQTRTLGPSLIGIVRNIGHELLRGGRGPPVRCALNCGFHDVGSNQPAADHGFLRNSELENHHFA
eukprot:2489269-Rhodomonas_salina.2